MKKLFLFLFVMMSISMSAQKNPILPEMHADPEVLADGGRYYIYSTTDGAPGWGGYYFTCYSSPDLKQWNYEGIILDLKKAGVRNTNAVVIQEVACLYLRYAKAHARMRLAKEQPAYGSESIGSDDES